MYIYINNKHLLNACTTLPRQLKHLQETAWPLLKNTRWHWVTMTMTNGDPQRSLLHGYDKHHTVRCFTHGYSMLISLFTFVRPSLYFIFTVPSTTLPQDIRKPPRICPGASWGSQVHHGAARCIMVHPGASWTSRCIMGHPDASWGIQVHHGPPGASWYIQMHHGPPGASWASRGIQVHHGASRCIMDLQVHHGASRCIMGHPDKPWGLQDKGSWSPKALVWPLTNCGHIRLVSWPSGMSAPFDCH